MLKRSIILLFLFAFIVLFRNEAYPGVLPAENPMLDKLHVPVELLNVKIPDKLPSSNYDVDMPKLPSFKKMGAINTNKAANNGSRLNSQELPEFLRDQHFVWPVIGLVSSGYGFRHIGISNGIHEGIDIPAPAGTPIMASRGGVVKRADSTLGGYGKIVIIDHGNGVETRYAHCSAYAVKKGDIVETGQIIAYVGRTGRATSSHLHFEVVVNGLAYNPMRFLGEHRSTITALTSVFSKK